MVNFDARPIGIEVAFVRIRRVRTAFPERDGYLRLHVTRIDQEPPGHAGVSSPEHASFIVHASGLTPNDLGILRMIEHMEGAVALGLLVMPGDARVMHWAVAETGQRVVQASAKERAISHVGESLPMLCGAVVMLLVGWLASSGEPPAVSLVFGLTGIVMLMFSMLSWPWMWIQLRQFNALSSLDELLSARSFCTTQQRADGVRHDRAHSARSATPSTCRPVRRSGGESSLFRRVEGSVDRLDLIVRERGNEGLRKERIYHITVDRQELRLHCRDKGPLPFLRSGDRITAVVRALDAGESKDAASLVYALYNHEDDEAFVAYRTFEHGQFDYPLPPRGRRETRSVLWGLAGLSAMLSVKLLLLLGMLPMAIPLAMVPVVVFAMFWAMPGLILAGTHLRWRAGYPSSSQRTVEQVHAMLGLPHPLSTAARNITDI